MATLKSGNPHGRPPLYDKWIEGEGLEKIKEWFANGLTNREVAKNIGVSTTTWNEWKNRFPVLITAKSESEKQSIELVANALFKNATGATESREKKTVLFPFTEKERAYIERKALEKARAENPDMTEDEEFELIMSLPVGRLVETEVKTKENKADTAAQIFYLKNKAPEIWSDKRTLETSGNINVNPLDGLSTDELMKIAFAEGKKDK